MKTFSVSLVIADDHPAVRIGIKAALDAASTIVVVDAVRNSTELISVLDSQACDVLVTDYAMPGGEYGDGISLLKFIQRRYPELKIIVMTMMDNPGVLRTLVTQGVSCILSKSDDSTHLIPAVHVAFSGGRYFSPTIESTVHLLDVGEPEASNGKDLTNREFEVVRLYVAGMTVNEIADQLRRSKQTVSSQKNSAMKKLGIERDADLIKYAMETGLLSSSAPPC